MLQPIRPVDHHLRLNGRRCRSFCDRCANGAIAFIVNPDFEAPADLDQNNQYQIVVTASDGDKVSSKAVTIAVGNANEAPTTLALSQTTVSEAATIGTVIGTLSGTDPDAGDSLTFSLVNHQEGLVTIDGNQLKLKPGSILKRFRALTSRFALPTKQPDPRFDRYAHRYGCAGISHPSGYNRG